MVALGRENGAMAEMGGKTKRAKAAPADTGLATGSQAPASPPRVLELAIGRRIRLLRRQRDLSTVDLSAAAGISTGMLSKIENGQISPSLSTLQSVAEALGVSISSLFATFEEHTDYFGSREQQAMINFRVRDLDAMLDQLRRAGADVDPETLEMADVGRFGWVTDPEGHRIELWQPS